MNEFWFRSLAWTDYRLAILFTVGIPLVLTVWSFVRRTEATNRLLIVYWRVASLLMIAIYLMAAAWGEDNTVFEALCGRIGFIAAWVARILIPLSLWFWVDLNDEIKDSPPSSLKLAVTSWRWAVTIYLSLGAIATLPFLSCAFSASALKTSFCQVWLEAPLNYRGLFHQEATAGFLGFLGLLGLTIYLLYFIYFLLARLGKQGRSALEQ